MDVTRKIRTCTKIMRITKMDVQYAQLSSPPNFSEVRVTRSLVLCVCFVDRCLSFCTFSFGHCVVCSSQIYEFLLPFWYQTLHRYIISNLNNWKFCM